MSKIIYIASPYSNKDTDIMEYNFQKVSALAAKLCSEGDVAFSPITYGHTLLNFEKMPVNWEFWENFCISFLKASDELLVYKMDGWEISKGVTAEIEYAKENNIPIRYMEPYKRKLVFLTGAGVSAESGIKTFRDLDGLWENHKVEDVASIRGWNMNQQLDFYNNRRRELLTTEPNEGHNIIAELEKYFDVSVITQNVDNLHEKAGSTNIIHLHGELLKARSTVDLDYVVDWDDDMSEFDVDDSGNQLRPHIVWFGEDVPLLSKAIKLVREANILVIVGTSMQVYPAAMLSDYASHSTPVYYIDPNPAKVDRNISVISEIGSIGLAELKKIIL
jgi:NAD-dependent deacetylase